MSYTISWGMVGMVLVGYLGLVVWFVVCSRCEAYEHGSWFGYRWDACERWLVWL
jgi:hypothetical protein